MLLATVKVLLCLDLRILALPHLMQRISIFTDFCVKVQSTRLFEAFNPCFVLKVQREILFPFDWFKEITIEIAFSLR